MSNSLSSSNAQSISQLPEMSFSALMAVLFKLYFNQEQAVVMSLSHHLCSPMNIDLLKRPSCW